MHNELDFFSIPIFIISYNRLDVLKKCIARFENDGYKNIIILDNASTNIFLVDYLKTVKHKVYFLKKNYGHHALWKCGLFDTVINKNYYVLTDPDILPIEKCPANYVEHFYRILQRYPHKVKVGFSLKIDDLPESYPYKYDMIRFESFYWEKRLNDKDVLYDAPLDTTFSLYRPGYIEKRNFLQGIRTGYPYMARHLGWYVDIDNFSAEDSSYYRTANTVSTSMNHEAIRLNRAWIIAELLKRDNITFYEIIKQVASYSYLKTSVSILSIIKGSAYIFIKKMLTIFKLR